MIDIFRYTEIAEATQRVLNPLADHKVALLGELLHLRPGMRVLDIGCGRGEMLSRYARDHGIHGTGVDIHPPFVEAARARAVELGVGDRVTFHIGDGAQHVDEPDGYSVGLAIGTTWIGGGLLGTIDLLYRWARRDGLLAVGEVFWAEPPPPELAAIHDPRGEFTDLVGILDRLRTQGLDLIEMVIASPDDWDRYEADQWPNVASWLLANPEDPIAGEVRDWWHQTSAPTCSAGGAVLAGVSSWSERPCNRHVRAPGVRPRRPTQIGSKTSCAHRAPPSTACFSGPAAAAICRAQRRASPSICSLHSAPRRPRMRGPPHSPGYHLEQPRSLRSARPQPKGD